MPDSKITLDARERCSKKTLAEQLEALRAEAARMEREADQADTIFAFECDRADVVIPKNRQLTKS